MHAVPGEIDKEVAKLKLSASGIYINEHTPKRSQHLSSWEEGT